MNSETNIHLDDSITSLCESYLIENYNRETCRSKDLVIYLDIELGVLSLYTNERNLSATMFYELHES